MKTNCWLTLGLMLATTAVAQVNTNKLPDIPPPATTPAAPAAPQSIAPPADLGTNAPAKKAVKAKKKATKKKTSAKHAENKSGTSAEKSAVLPSAPVILVSGPATVVADNVNLRGQAGLKGEVVGHVKKGDTVTVLSEITLDKPKAGEPAQWAKIGLPAGTKVWIDSKYVDTTNNIVSVKKLNLRGGPGENFSVLGVIEKGAAVTPISTKGDWMQIEPPSSAFAFLAANFLKQEAGMETNAALPSVAANTESTPPPMPPTPPPAPTPTTVPEAPAIAPPAATPPVSETPAPPATTETPATTPAAPATSETPATPLAMTPTPTLAPDETQTDTNLPPPPPRIVTHEGTVRHSVSPVAPTYYELYSPSDDKAIDYLFTTSTNLNLARYDGLRITVTGEEGLDPRWKDTPVITIQKIYVLSPEKTKLKPIRPPR